MIPNTKLDAAAFSRPAARSRSSSRTVAAAHVATSGDQHSCSVHEFCRAMAAPRSAASIGDHVRQRSPGAPPNTAPSSRTRAPAGIEASDRTRRRPTRRGSSPSRSRSPLASPLTAAARCTDEFDGAVGSPPSSCAARSPTSGSHARRRRRRRLVAAPGRGAGSSRLPVPPRRPLAAPAAEDRGGSGGSQKARSSGDHDRIGSATDSAVERAGAR